MNNYFMTGGRTLAAIWVVAASFTAIAPIHAFTDEDEETRIRTFERSLFPAISIEGKPEQRWTLSERMAYYKVPGMSIAVIRDGKVAWAKGYGVLQVGKPEKVDTQTVFSVGSMSKVGAAATTLRLVQAGNMNLDKDVNSYITKWKVPENIYTAIRPVTLRGILSHTAGLTVGGFPDFQPDVPIPSVIDTLQGRAPAMNEPVRVEYLPGSKALYSGGGTTVEQLIIEESTGLAFAQAAHRYVFEPLGMARSTYENPSPRSHGNIAKAHGPDGVARALPRGYETMPESAASGLWTTPSDYAQLVIAIIESYKGKKGSFLSQALAHQMLTEVWPSTVGLGPFLHGTGLDRRFFHSGSNDSYKAYMEGHPNTGNGVVVLTNGALGGALMEEVVRAVALAEDWAPALRGHQRLDPVNLPLAELEDMVGFYAEDKEGGQLQHVVLRGSWLYLQRGQYEPGKFYRLIPIGPTRFVLDGRNNTQIRFVRGYAGQIIGMLREADSGQSIADTDLLKFLGKVVPLRDQALSH